MKIRITRGLTVLAIALFAANTIQAQGTTTFVSNLGQAPDGSHPIGSDSWLAVQFLTGNNPGGYELGSIQLSMSATTGKPGGFSVMLYTPLLPLTAGYPECKLATLGGSADPATGGIYSYTPASSLILSPNNPYLIVLDAGTAVASGAYEWNYMNIAAYNPNGGWKVGGTMFSTDGAYPWKSIDGHFQFAINATAVPEPGIVNLTVAPGNLRAVATNTLADVQYGIQSRTNLAQSDWQSEGYIVGSKATNWTPFSIAQNGRTNLFIRLRLNTTE